MSSSAGRRDEPGCGSNEQQVQVSNYASKEEIKAAGEATLSILYGEKSTDNIDGYRQSTDNIDDYRHRVFQ